MPHKSDVQVALISGGTSGIGFATAKLLLKRRLVRSLNGRNEKIWSKKLRLSCAAILQRYSTFKVMYLNLKIVSAL